MAEPTIRRILVALDASPHSLAALESAVQLAAALEAELEGLFVEDVDLLTVAALPITREVGSFTALVRPLAPEELERQLKAQARRAREALAATADRAQLRWSFRVARGRVAHEILSAATESDLVTFGRVGWSPRQRRRMGGTARALIASAPAPALVLQHGLILGRPVLLLQDSSPEDERALDLAITLASLPEATLEILVAASGDMTERLLAAAQSQLEQRDAVARFHRIEPKVEAITETARFVGAGLLILPGSSEAATEDSLAELMAGLHCPVLVAR